MKFEILSDIEDVQINCADALLEFDYQILSSIGLELNNCFPESMKSIDFSVENKKKLRLLLNKFGLKIEDYRDGSQEIYSNQELIGKWKKPWVSWKAEGNKVYAQIIFENWSLFEDDVL